MSRGAGAPPMLAGMRPAKDAGRRRDDLFTVMILAEAVAA
jgi:hypothetical protein